MVLKNLFWLIRSIRDVIRKPEKTYKSDSDFDAERTNFTRDVDMFQMLQASFFAWDICDKSSRSDVVMPEGSAGSD